MQCSKCGTEMIIASTKTAVEGDTSRSTPTKVFTVQQLQCRNKQCDSYGRVQQEVATKIYDDEET